MAFIGESQNDWRDVWHYYVCLNKKDFEIVLKAIAPIIDRYLRSYQYYKDIIENGVGTDKQKEALMIGEENFNHIIELRNLLAQYLKDYK